MVLTQRSRYAVRAVLELARHEGGSPMKAADIASAQRIPLRFLENILAQLRQSGIVESVRGKEGGYMLGRRAEDLSVGEIIRLLEGQLPTIDCREASEGGDCPLQAGCVLLPMWREAHQAMMDVFDCTTFHRLLEQQRDAQRCYEPDYVI